jgi:hypothetical protein
MNHINRNWRRRWKLDIPAAAAVHESGARVRFVPADAAADMPPDVIGGLCTDAAGKEWLVVNALSAGELDAWLVAQTRQVGTARIMRYVGRIFREAGELWAKRNLH